MNSVFDTNVFRRIAEGVITTNMVTIGRIMSRELGFHGLVSPLSIIELGSHVTETNRDNFFKYKQAFSGAMEISEGGIEDPDSFMRGKVFRDISLPPAISGQNTYDLCRLYAMAKNFDELHEKRLISWESEPKHATLTKEFLHDHRQNAEQKYISDMFDWVVNTFIPNYDSIKSNSSKPPIMDEEVLHPVLGKVKKAFVLDVLDSTEFSIVFAKSQASRVNVDVSTWTDEQLLAASDRLSAYRDAYKYIIHEILNSGYNYVKNKNDMNDLLFLIYLADQDNYLVTYDTGFVKKLSPNWKKDASPDLSRIYDYKQWISLG